MQILDVTPEQQATFTRQKTRRVKETQMTLIDKQTGELLSETDSQTIITGAEPDYIKIYYRTVLAFGGITNISVDFLMAMSSFITWTSDTEPMLFQNTKITREHISADCHIKIDMYKKYISRCVKSGLLIVKPGYRGVYEVNPFFIARGRWEDITKLRATFDFIGGKWQKHIECDDKEAIK